MFGNKIRAITTLLVTFDLAFLCVLTICIGIRIECKLKDKGYCRRCGIETTGYVVYRTHYQTTHYWLCPDCQKILIEEFEKYGMTCQPMEILLP